MSLLNLSDISLSFGGPLLLDKINIQIEDGEKICLLGRNGIGKSSLMKIINGELEPDSGKLIYDKNYKISFLDQSVPENLSGTIYEIIEEGYTDTDNQGSEHQVEKILSLLSLEADKIFSTLSAGMKRKVMLAKALVSDPDLILLDEPTNHLDIDSIKWLETFFHRYEKSVFFVTHDRTFLQKIATRIIELDRGRLFDWKCDYNTFLKRKDDWIEAENTRNDLFDKKLAIEETWIRKGIKARRTRNEGRVRALKKMREERSNRREQMGSLNLSIQDKEKSGKLIVEAKNISFSYDEEKLISDFSIRIVRGDKIGVIGANGCGKSTLTKILFEDLSPDQGSITKGVRINKAYFDQLRDQLNDELTVRQSVTDGGEMINVNGRSKHVIGYLQDFLFPPDRVTVKVKVLSGGEKNRLLLAKLFAKPANLLILDEPTNDLDLETVELLEELLLEFQGTLILVSHDRSFLNNVVTNIIAFNGDGVLSNSVGGYDDYLSQNKEEVIVSREKKQREKNNSNKNKITFKERKELEQIPDIIEEKENRKNEIFEIMSNPDFYKRDGSEISLIKEEMVDLELELDRLLERWEELDGKDDK